MPDRPFATVPTQIDFIAPTPEGSPLRLAFDVPCQILEACTIGDVCATLESVDALARQGYWCVGYVRYEAAAAFDSALKVHPADGPLVWFGVHAAVMPLSEDNTNGLTQAQWDAGLSRNDFDQAMTDIHAAIAKGDLYQLNYTTQHHGTLQGTPRDLYAALRRAQPGGFAAFVDTGKTQILSVSPELFFDWDGEHILVRPIKGTAPRGVTSEADAALAAQLLASPKERAENVMIVDLIRNDLSRIARLFSVRVSKLFRIEPLLSLWQMSSDIEARTRPGTRLVDVFAALFPCGSVTGAPKVQAMDKIRALEPEPRGVYCGAVGVVRPGGHATFNVAIRTVVVQDGQLRCGIGSGITADATAEGEWQEWYHKRAFLDRASAPFALLETLALDDGTLRHGSAHLARMARAAVHFGYPWDAVDVQTRLAQLSQHHPQGVWRVRLMRDAQGQTQVQAFAMTEVPAPVRLQLAATPFEAADSEFVRFKTTRRAHYDAYAPTLPDIFDTLLWNVRGELTECTRGNIAVQLDGRWLTPPLNCGLLNGIGRAHYLHEGRLGEAVIRLEDLPRATGLAFVNSLRGWIDAVLV